MYSFTPKRTNNNAKLLSFVLLLSSGLIFMASSFCGIYRGMIQTLALCMLTVGIFITTRFCLKNFTYIIEEYDGGYDFIVNEVQGKRIFTVCRLSLNILMTCVPSENEKSLELKAKPHNYCVDIRPSDAYILIFRDIDNDIAVKITPDETLLKIFKSAIEQNTGEKNI